MKNYITISSIEIHNKLKLKFQNKFKSLAIINKLDNHRENNYFKNEYN